jgi:hypothetical protein
MQRHGWLLACVLAVLCVGAAAYLCFLRWPASTVGALIGAAIVAVSTLTLAPGEKPWWTLPALGAAAVLTVAALGVFLLTVCWRH